MYLYFNTNGVLKEIINDVAIREGDVNSNKVYAYFENDAIISAAAYILFSNDTNATAELEAENNLMTIPYDPNRDLKYFKDGVSYQFYSFILGGEVDQETLEPEYTLVSGPCKMTIIGATASNQQEAQGMVIFNIEDSVIMPDIQITQAQLQYMLGLIAGKQDVANLTNELGNSQVLYPSQKAVKDAVDGLESDISGLDSRLDTAEGIIENNTRDINGLGNRLESDERDILSNSTDIGNIKQAYVVSAEIVDSGDHEGELLIIYKINNVTSSIYFKSANNWGEIGGNIEDQTDLKNALDDKVDKVEGKGLSENDFTDSLKDKLDGIEAGAEVNVLEGVQQNGVDLSIANKKVNVIVPTKTSDLTNDGEGVSGTDYQFASKNFVNSSIATNTAYFLGTFNQVSDLHMNFDDEKSDVAEELGTFLANDNPTNNDYCFVQVPTSNATPTQIASIDRYKYNSQMSEWIYEYTLNNSSFTAAQWAAINSGITDTKVGTYDTHVADTTIHVTAVDKSAWSGKQDAITSSNKLSSDLVDDYNNTNKFVTAQMYEYLDNQLYQAPEILDFVVCDTSQVVIGTTQEIGSTFTAKYFRHKESNISNVSGFLSVKIGTSSVASGQAVDTDNNYMTSLAYVPISTSVTFTLSGTNTKGNTFSKDYKITYYTYNYTIANSSETAPTTGLTKRSVQGNTSGFDVSYASGDYIYFYDTRSGRTVQQNVLGQWTDISTTSLGQVSITLANNTTATYYAYRIGPFGASGSDKFRVN